MDGVGKKARVGGDAREATRTAQDGYGDRVCLLLATQGLVASGSIPPIVGNSLGPATPPAAPSSPNRALPLANNKGPPPSPGCWEVKERMPRVMVALVLACPGICPCSFAQMVLCEAHQASVSLPVKQSLARHPFSLYSLEVKTKDVNQVLNPGVKAASMEHLGRLPEGGDPGKGVKATAKRSGETARPELFEFVLDFLIPSPLHTPSHYSAPLTIGLKKKRWHFGLRIKALDQHLASKFYKWSSRLLSSQLVEGTPIYPRPAALPQAREPLPCTNGGRQPGGLRVQSGLDLGQVWNPRPRPQSGRLQIVAYRRHW